MSSASHDPAVGRPRRASRGQPPAGRPIFRERLRVPVRWWMLSTVLVASFWLAMVAAVPERIAWAVTAALLLLSVLLLRSYGSPQVVVTDEWLQAGRARIRRCHLGTVTALDPQAMRSQAGQDADARAHLLLRPYVPSGVHVVIEDPRDPTPYWLISSRRASALAAALDGAPVEDART